MSRCECGIVGYFTRDPIGGSRGEEGIVCPVCHTIFEYGDSACQLDDESVWCDQCGCVFDTGCKHQANGSTLDVYFAKLEFDNDTFVCYATFEEANKATRELRCMHVKGICPNARYTDPKWYELCDD